MPSGKVHDFYWKKVVRLAIVFVLVLWFVLDLLFANLQPFTCDYGHCFSTATVISLGVLLGYLLGKFITPDLDMPGITQNEWEMMKRFKLIGAIFVAVWMPYGYVMKHRSFLSHSYIFSTLLRMVYMFWWVAFIGYTVLNVLLLGTLIGLGLSDALHIWLDKNYKDKK